MTPKNVEIIEAVCCENLSDTEAAMAFKCSVEDIHLAIHEAMQASGYKRDSLWQLLGKPKIDNFKFRRRTAPIGAAEKIMRSRVDARNEYIRRGQISRKST